jgi:hypothetical protein
MGMSNIDALKLALIPGRLEEREQFALGKGFVKIGRLHRGLIQLRDSVYCGVALSAILLYATAFSIWTIASMLGTALFARCFKIEMGKYQSVMINRTASSSSIRFLGPLF